MTVQTFDPALLARKASGLDAHIRRRNRFEYIAGGLTIAVVLAIAALAAASGISTLADGILVAGMLVLAAGMGIVLLQIRSRTGVPHSTDGRQPTVAALRFELTRQRDALRKVWLWYLLPFMPGLVLIYGADVFRPGGRPVMGLVLFAATLAVIVFIAWLNLVAARRMDEEIARLDAETGRRF